jgi:2-amino-4-hydroxy-6-hydroxymethyldihydropteridine diphosphokinase
LQQRYIVALGSNRRHLRHGRPRQILRAALDALEAAGLTVEAAAPVITTPPLGHTRRRYANGAVLLRTQLTPDALLATLKGIERAFGRRQRGQRWGDRVLDLDILLWSGGAWASPGLIIPHIAFRARTFALQPAAALAPDWRDPLTGLTLRQLHGRLTRAGRLPIGHTRSGP